MTGPAHVSRYATPEDMSRALTDHLRQRAAQSGIEHANLRRQFVYDRLLARIFTGGDAEWVLKGGTALLARTRRARHTVDVDLARRSGTVHDAVDELRSAVGHDLGDHLRFEFGPPSVRAGGPGRATTGRAKVPVIARIGIKVFEQFPIDVVVGSVMTAEPDTLSPSIVIDFDGLVPPVYLVYPVVDHIADKVCATFEKHGASDSPSTRSRDLVDLVVIARTQTVEGTAVRTAIEAERLHRGLPPIDAFTAPPQWARSYARAATGVADCADHRSLAAAVGLVRRFLDPVMSADPLPGVWSPDSLSWSSPDGC